MVNIKLHDLFVYEITYLQLEALRGLEGICISLYTEMVMSIYSHISHKYLIMQNAPL